MRHPCGVWLWLFIVAAVCSAAQRGGDGAAAAEPFLGTWAGTWDGAGSGGFELILEKDKDGAVSGKVSVTGEPTYKATLKTISFDGKKMTAKYDFPPDEAAQVLLAASFDGNRATGTWSLREKAGDNEVASGGWTVTRKSQAPQ
jgi:hypothetical protein